MTTTQQAVNRMLQLLRDTIRERGFTQAQVEESLGWSRRYISRLLTQRDVARLEHLLMILDVMDVKPYDFFDQVFQPQRCLSSRCVSCTTIG